MRRFLSVLAVVGLTFSSAYAQSEKFVGIITVITDDKSAITIDSEGKNVTMATDPEFVDMAYFEVGDKVEIEASKQGETLKAESFRYIFDEIGDEKDDPDQVQAAGHAEDVPAAAAAPAAPVDPATPAAPASPVTQ